MENTNTDARKAAEEILGKHLNFNNYDETERGYVIDAMLEFAQSRPATLDKGEVSIQWNKTSEKPLINWNDDHTRWVESNHCPSGYFLAGLYVGNNETGKYRFECYKVVLTENGLREVADDDNFDTGYEIDDFEYWMPIPEPESLSEQPPYGIISEGQPDSLHEDSRQMLRVCFEELRLKMISNQKKYGYSNEWLTQDWEQECREDLYQHLAKGDPRDVAIYAMFMMYRGWSTKSIQVVSTDVLNVFRWLLGYDEFPSKQVGDSNYYWRSHLRKELHKIGVTADIINPFGKDSEQPEAKPTETERLEKLSEMFQGFRNNYEVDQGTGVYYLPLHKIDEMISEALKSLKQ